MWIRIFLNVIILQCHQNTKGAIGLRFCSTSSSSSPTEPVKWRVLSTCSTKCQSRKGIGRKIATDQDFWAWGWTASCWSNSVPLRFWWRKGLRSCPAVGWYIVDLVLWWQGCSEFEALGRFFGITPRQLRRCQPPQSKQLNDHQGSKGITEQNGTNIDEISTCHQVSLVVGVMLEDPTRTYRMTVNATV